MIPAFRYLVDLACDRDRYRFICQAIFAIALLVVVVSFASTRNGQTPFGPELGADFTAFYSAASILRRPAPDSSRLYDRDLQDQVYHELLPEAPHAQVNPFVHPPFVAWAISWLTLLDYPVAFAIWLCVSLTLYVSGIAMLLGTSSHLDRAARFDVLLLALAYEPFVMECWLGGQLSAIAFFLLALAVCFDRGRRDFLVGLVLGLLLYKFTLLVVIGPALVVARRWTTLGGFAVSAGLLVAFSWLVVGETNCVEYLRTLTGFATNAVGEGLQLRVWKWIDLNFFWRQLLGGPSIAQRLLFLGTALPVLGLAVWHGGARGIADTDPRRRQVGWAILATATCVANLYLAIYDSVLAVAAAILMADALLGRHGRLPDAFRSLVAGTFAFVWLSQPIARATGFQGVTVLLAIAVASFAKTSYAWGRTTERNDAPLT